MTKEFVYNPYILRGFNCLYVKMLLLCSNWEMLNQNDASLWKTHNIAWLHINSIVPRTTISRTTNYSRVQDVSSDRTTSFARDHGPERRLQSTPRPLHSRGRSRSLSDAFIVFIELSYLGLEVNLNLSCLSSPRWNICPRKNS